MSKPTEGAVYRQTGVHGLGQRARIADPDIAADLNTLPLEMTQLDMPADAVVTVIGHDDDRDLVLVEWADSTGTDRITSMPAAELAENFTEES